MTRLERLRRHARLFAAAWSEVDPSVPFDDDAFRGAFWAVLVTLVVDVNVHADALTTEPLVALFATIAAIQFLDLERAREEHMALLTRRRARPLRLAA